MTEQSINTIFDFAPDVHLVKIQAGGKNPVEGEGWRNRKITAEESIAWLDTGGRLAIVPATARTSVADIDKWAPESLALAKRKVGDPVEMVETDSSTKEKPRWHCIYPHDPAVKVGNAKWAGGDLRVDAGYVVIWDLPKWADTIAKIAVQDLPPVDLSVLKSTKSLILGAMFDEPEGLHPATLSELGRAISDSDTWTEAKDRCEAIIQEHTAKRHRQIESGANRKETETKLKNEVAGWRRAMPEWWKEREDKIETIAQTESGSIYQLRPAPYITPFPITQPSRLLTDAFNVLGVKFRTNITRNLEECWIPGFTKDANGDTIWEPITDGFESVIAQILEWNIQYRDAKRVIQSVNMASSNAKLKDYIAGALHVNAYHPFKDWLDRLPEWDGTPRIGTMLTDLGLDIDIEADFKEWAESYLVVDPIRLNVFPGSERKTHLVLSGGTNAGKSQLVRQLFPPHLATDDYQNDGFVFTPDKTDQMYQVHGYIICEGSEFTGGDIKSIRAAKSFLSQRGYAGARIRFAKRALQGYRTDCLYFSTNDHAPLPPDDPAMDGRLIMAKVRGECRHDGTNPFPELGDLVDPFGNTEAGTLRDQLWAEAYAVVKQACGGTTTARNPYLPPKDLAIKANEWNALCGAHYDTELTVRREIMQAAIELLAQDGKIMYEELIAEMYRVETNNPIVELADKPDFEFIRYKGQQKRHQIKNAMKSLGWRWSKQRYGNGFRWVFYNGNHVSKTG